MEVHAHSHTARKKWTHYFWEFLMLFLAVFCGFLAEYQLEHYIEKQRAKDFALSLHRDLVADTAIFNSDADRLKICIRKIDTLIGLLGDAKQIRENTASVYSLSVYAFIYPLSTPNESTLQQLLNSGSLRYFKNNSLADSIKAYNNSVQLFKDFSLSATNINIEFRKSQMQIIDINPMISFIGSGRVSTDALMKIADSDFLGNKELLTTDLVRLKEHANWCAMKKFYFSNSTFRYNELKRRATAVLKLLSQKYHIKE
jgi:hypothetical protein